MHVNPFGISAAIVGLALISVTEAMPMPVQQTNLQAIQPALGPSMPKQAVIGLQPLVAVFPPPPDQGAPSSRPRGAASRLHALRLIPKA